MISVFLIGFLDSSISPAEPFSPKRWETPSDEVTSLVVDIAELEKMVSAQRWFFLVKLVMASQQDELLALSEISSVEQLLATDEMAPRSHNLQAAN